MKRILELTTTIGCRLGCSYCPQGKLASRYRSLTRGRGPTTMPWETFKTCLDKLPEEVDIHFSGYSEPWLHPDCGRMILRAHARGHRVAVFTTAAGMSPHDVQRIARIPFKRFSVHLPDSNGMMKSPIDTRYRATLAALQAANIQNIDFFSIGPTHPDVLDVIEHVADTRLLTLRAGNLMRLDNSLRAVSSSREPNRPIVCRKDRIFQNVLLPSGHVALCCMDYGLDHVLGNLLELDYHSLHRGRRFLRVLRESVRGGESILCGRCEYAVEGQYHWKLP